MMSRSIRSRINGFDAYKSVTAGTKGAISTERNWRKGTVSYRVILVCKTSQPYHGYERLR